MKQGILPDPGPAIDRFGKTLEAVVTRFLAEIDLAHQARIDGWIQGGLIAAAALIVLYLFTRKGRSE